VVGAPARTRTTAGATVAALLVLLAGCSGRPAPPARAGPAPTGLATSLDDESTPLAGGLLSWRTFWSLCWDPYAGAGGYEVRVLTGEGASGRLLRQDGHCYRIEAAAGESTPAARATDRAQLLAAQRGQLAIQVRAVVGTTRSDWSTPVAVGSE